MREAVADGKENVLVAFMEAVHEQLSLEHKQWLGNHGSVGGALAKLEEALKKTSQNPGEK